MGPQKRIQFDIRQHLPEIDPNDFDKRNAVTDQNPFSPTKIIFEGNTVGEVKSIGLKHQCYIRPPMCRVFYNAFGEVKANGFEEALERIASVTTVPLDYIEFNHLVKKEGDNWDSVIETITWNEGNMQGFNFTTQTPQEYGKKSRLYKIFNRIINS